ncbi:MAG: GIY-YIG nuclease family protein [Clostridiales bacterium]|nr:GIY-YIG nuclease family protein [Clostridiales bacterium]
MNYKQIYAIKQQNQKRILMACPGCPERSGIYMLTREENGFKYGYVGQAKNILGRLADHLNGYQHIDLSLKKHGLYSAENPTGWKIDFMRFDSDLDAQEQYYIKLYADKGYQMRNKTVGGQGQGKTGLDNSKAPKGYYDGLKQGYKNAQRDVIKWMKHLNVRIKSNKPNKIQEKALNKLLEFIEGENDISIS